MSYSSPIYPQVAVVSNSPAPCASCGGAMEQDLVFDDLLQCTACGCRRSARQAPAAAAASGRDDAIREVFDDVLETLLMNVTRRMHLQGITTDKEILAVWQPYEVAIRKRLEDALMGKG